jgi:excinuclease ABC subunit B
VQESYNCEHGITPITIRKRIHDITEQMESEHDRAVRANLMLDEEIFNTDPKKLMKLKNKEMNEAVAVLDFETAAILRDEIRAIERKIGSH